MAGSSTAARSAARSPALCACSFICQRSLQACSISLQGWGLIDLQLRAAFSPAYPRADIFHPPCPPIASQSISRDVPFARARAFHPLYRSLGEWPRLPFTARIERAPFHRARSASKKGTWPLPSSSFGGRALREHRRSSGSILSLCEQEGRSGCSPVLTLVAQTTTARCGMTTPRRVLLNASPMADAVVLGSIGSNRERCRGEADGVIGKHRTVHPGGWGLR